MACLHFNPLVEIGSDTVYELAKEAKPAELIKLAKIKRIAVNRVVKSLSSLL